MHAGRAWASDTVTAYQGERLLSRGLVLLNAIEPDLIRHAATMPDLPGPNDSIPIERPVLFPGIEAREVEVNDPVTSGGAPARYLWLRMPTGYDSVAANQAIVAWCQPGFIIELAMRPHRDTAQIHDEPLDLDRRDLAYRTLPRRRRRESVALAHAGSDVRRQWTGRRFARCSPKTATSCRRFIRTRWCAPPRPHLIPGAVCSRLSRSTRPSTASSDLPDSYAFLRGFGLSSRWFQRSSGRGPRTAHQPATGASRRASSRTLRPSRGK